MQQLQPWEQGSGPRSRHTQNNNFELFFKQRNPSRWERQAAQRHIDPDSWNQRLKVTTLTDLTTNQLEECPRADQTLFLEHYKTHQSLQVGTHSFDGSGPLCLARRRSYSFLLHSKLLSPRFNSVLGYRGQIQLHNLSRDQEIVQNTKRSSVFHCLW